MRRQERLTLHIITCLARIGTHALSTAALGSARISSTNACALSKPCLAAAGSLTTENLQALYDFNTVIMTAARVPQIWSNYKVGDKPVTNGPLEPAPH